MPRSPNAHPQTFVTHSGQAFGGALSDTLVMLQGGIPL
jgi:hypothetical protein